MPLSKTPAEIWLEGYEEGLGNKPPRCSGNPYRPDGVPEAAQLYADARAIADVRTLDDWEDNHPTIGTIRIERRRHGHVALIADDFNAVIELPAKNRAEARAKAAAWVREQKRG